MSSSSRFLSDTDTRVELPVFVAPNELVFSPEQRQTFLTIFNPYGNEAHFKILTTNPERFDVNLTKGTVKPNRRIDITIRLLNNRSGDSIESLDEKQLMDHFRVSINVSTLKGSRQIKVYWCTKVDYLDSNTELPISSFVDDKTQRIKSRASKQSPIGVKPHLSSVSNITQQSRLAIIRSSRSQINGPSDSGSNVNLICFICASICILTLFLPLAIDYELCRKAKSYSEQTSAKPTGLLAQLYSILSVSYEMKFGCSFALGLFTYRLISTMPN